MCTTRKVVGVQQEEPEVIKKATQADASTQKANVDNRTNAKNLISQNIRTTNNGLEEDVVSSKKKLLGE